MLLSMIVDNDDMVMLQPRISYFFTLYILGSFSYKALFLFFFLNVLFILDLVCFTHSVLQIKPTFKYFITKKKKINILHKWRYFYLHNTFRLMLCSDPKEKHNFSCSLSLWKAQACASPQAMREMQMMNIHSYLVLTSVSPGCHDTLHELN